MTKRTHGYRAKSRSILRKHPRERGRPGLIRWMYEYNPGDKVIIDIDPTNITTAPHRRYQGRVGTVAGLRGKALIIEVQFDKVKKTIITTPDHVRPFKAQSTEAAQQ
ncbi:MAG: 50S ribosomal protein L21e [Thermocladium sp.]